MTKNILEQAIAHLLNDNAEKAQDLFHKFMVARARQIHESLRQGEEVALTEGWDDEISSETYFTEADLDAAEDADGAAADEIAGDLNADELAGPVDADADAAPVDDFGAEDELDGELPADGEEAAVEGGVEERVDSLEDKLDTLIAEFEAKMAELDGEYEGGEDDAAAEFGGDEAAADVDADADVDAELDVDADADADAEEEKVAEDEEFEDFDSITESVLSDLEKIAVSLDTEGREVGTGKSFTPNTKTGFSGKANMADAKPNATKPEKRDGFEREASPAVKVMPKRINGRNKAEDGMKDVPQGGDKSALLNSDFAGRPQK